MQPDDPLEKLGHAPRHPPPRADEQRRRSYPSLIEHVIARMARTTLLSNRMRRDERSRVVSNLFHEGGRHTPFVHRFVALMVLSSLIAVLGLLADSTAVVIGAMIVAPLMAPVLGIAAAMVMDWPRRALVAGTTVALGSLMAIFLSAVTSFILPTPEEIPAEVLARTAPNLLDLGVAVFAGSAGAYAQIRRAAGEALTGVAVAVALVPPLAVIGITLEMGQWTLAAGAVLLYLTNVAGIILSAAATFVLCGFVPPGRLLSGRTHVARSLRLAAFAVLLVLAPLQLTDAWRERRPINEEETRSAVKEVLEESNPNAAVISIEIDTEEGERTIDITASDEERPIDLESLAEELSDKLDVDFKLAITTLEAHSESATVHEGDAEGEVKVEVEEPSEDVAETTDSTGTETDGSAPDDGSDGADGEEPAADAGDGSDQPDDEVPDGGSSDGNGSDAETEPTLTNP